MGGINKDNQKYQANKNIRENINKNNPLNTFINKNEKHKGKIRKSDNKGSKRGKITEGINQYSCNVGKALDNFANSTTKIMSKTLAEKDEIIKT